MIIIPNVIFWLQILNMVTYITKTKSEVNKLPDIPPIRINISTKFRRKLKILRNLPGRSKA